MSSKPPWETDQREVFRATFDDDAATYDRVRPVAPASVFDDVVSLAGLQPGSSIVELGPGTGQATVPLARRELRIVALELGAHLAQRTRENVASFPLVEVVTSCFERWDPGAATFDAVFACNSFHWMDPDTRFSKSADLLRPRGHLILLSTPWVIPDDADEFWWDVQDDYAAVGGERVDPATKHPDQVSNRFAQMRGSGPFEDPHVRRTLFSLTFSADDYAANLSTQSSMKEFAPDARAELIERIRRRIVERGGTVTAHLLAVLMVARVRK
jgi:SAM-dependent methyltransferase